MAILHGNKPLILQIITVHYSTIRYQNKVKSCDRYTYSINVSLVEEDEEYDVVPKAADPVHRRHLDDEGEDVIDESV